MKLFLTASEARNFGTRNVRVIHNEIRHIEMRILDAVDVGKLEVTITDSPYAMGSTITLPPMEYWRVWQHKYENRVAQLHLDSVTTYFANLGYGIGIRPNPSAPNAIAWVIHW